jgi:hypothetical protein
MFVLQEALPQGFSSLQERASARDQQTIIPTSGHPHVSRPTLPQASITGPGLLLRQTRRRPASANTD